MNHSVPEYQAKRVEELVFWADRERLPAVLAIAERAATLIKPGHELPRQGPDERPGSSTVTARPGGPQDQAAWKVPRATAERHPPEPQLALLRGRRAASPTCTCGRASRLGHLRRSPLRADRSAPADPNPRMRARLLVRIHGAGASHELISHLPSLSSRRRTALFHLRLAITEADEQHAAEITGLPAGPGTGPPGCGGSCAAPGCRLLSLPARLVRHARARVLKISRTWPWKRP